MKFGKTELIRRISDVVRKGWSDVHLRDLIESLWRDPFSMRTSGFVKEGGTDSLIAADVTSTVINGITIYAIIFQITPKGKKFDFYQFREILTYHKKYKSESKSFDAEEGLHVVYYDFDPETYEQVLCHIHNPSHDDMQEIMQWVVPISFLYFDAEKHEIIYFGNNRHGSWWNPWIHFAWHQTFNSMRETGLEFTDLLADGDGSENEHAEFGISAGTCFHEDIHDTSEGLDSPANIPVWYFKSGNLPRIHESSTNSLVIDGLLCYNSGGEVLPADDGNFVMYHIFFSNDILEPFISVMGQAQYAKVSQASQMAQIEVQAIKDLLPHQNLLHIGTLLFQTSAAFGNAYKSRIVTQTFGVITKWTTVGDGSPTNPVMIDNDEPNPTPGKVYGTDPISGIKKWVDLDPRLFRSGQIIYLQSEDSDITGYKQATTVEPDGAAVSYSKTTIPLSGEQSIKKFVTPAGYPGKLIIPAGPWIFTTWAAVNTNDLCVNVVRVYKRDEEGLETELFYFSQDIMAVAFTQYMKTVPQNQIELDTTTERLVVEFLFQNYGSNENTMYLAVEGNEEAEFWWSSIQLPLPPAAPQVQADWEEEDPDSPAFILNKPTIPGGGLEIGDWIEDISFDWSDVEEGVAQTWVLDPKASFAYNIIAVVLESDSTMDDLAIKIDGTAVGGMSAIDVTTGTSETSATSGNAVSVGSRVTMVSSGTDGAPTLIRGKLKIQRT